MFKKESKTGTLGYHKNILLVIKKRYFILCYKKEKCFQKKYKKGKKTDEKFIRKETTQEKKLNNLYKAQAALT